MAVDHTGIEQGEVRRLSEERKTHSRLYLGEKVI